ncbi:MAG: RNA polymerase sigma-70 factor [Bacteroidia bacterium]|nr:RNA polymerase sigma-70 factor [Bacteroidia bacterium]
MSDFPKEIFYQNYGPLCNYAAAIVKDSAVAEDIVQNLFIQLWQKSSFQKVKQIEGFLLRATKFKCIDYLRSNQKTRLISLESYMAEASVGPSPFEIQEKDIEPLFHYFAAKLPPKTQEVFLKSRNGMSYREIAEDLDISIKTVENQMGRALKHMRSMLKEQNLLTLLLFLQSVF